MKISLLYFLMLVFYFDSNQILYAKDCVYIKKVEYKNQKILKATTEYNCKDLILNPNIKKNKIIIKTQKLNINKKNKTQYINSRVISHSDYMRMIYNSEPIFLKKKPSDKLEKFLYPIFKFLYF
tara:strand:- start:304 stop:675 length:372 start_codon:yes stop_codon:yes gene_type:complete